MRQYHSPAAVDIGCNLHIGQINRRMAAFNVKHGTRNALHPRFDLLSKQTSRIEFAAGHGVTTTSCNSRIHYPPRCDKSNIVVYGEQRFGIAAVLMGRGRQIGCNVAWSNRTAVVSTFSGMLTLAQDTLCTIHVRVPTTFVPSNKHNMVRRTSKFGSAHCKYLRYAIEIRNLFPISRSFLIKLVRNARKIIPLCLVEFLP